MCRVGQKLSDLTTSRVVLMVLAMLFVLPIFNIGSGIYGTPPALGPSTVQVLKLVFTAVFKAMSDTWRHSILVSHQWCKRNPVELSL